MNRPVPRTIRARIAPQALSRVTRMYSAQIPEILSELLQNARRSAASALTVTVGRATPGAASGPSLVEIEDNGCGIADPSVLLAFADNGWSAQTVADEDAAGMGMLSLAQTTTTLVSRVRGEAPWQVTLEPRHFTGEREAPLRAFTDPFPEQGTRVAFAANASAAVLRNELHRLTVHYPVPTTFIDRSDPDHPQPQRMPSRPFVEPRGPKKTWKGLELGLLVGHPGDDPRAPNLNFHGHTLHVDLPAVHDMEGRAWTVRIDVGRCPKLELVLPGRERAVETRFLHRVRREALRFIYEQMASAPYRVTPSAHDVRRAKRHGVTLTPAEPRLAPWRPRPAFDPAYRRGKAPEATAPGPDALLVSSSMGSALAATLWRAAQRHGIEHRLFAAEPRFAGYPWYERIERITGTHILLEDESGTYPMLEDPPAADDPAKRAERITLDLHVSANRTGHDSARRVTLEADLALCASARVTLPERPVILARGCAVAAPELADLITRATFTARYLSDPQEADAQRQRFHDGALVHAHRLLGADDRVLHSAITRAFQEHLAPLIPPGRSLAIMAKPGDFNLELAASA